MIRSWTWWPSSVQGSDIKLHLKLIIFALYPYSLLHPTVAASVDVCPAHTWTVPSVCMITGWAPGSRVVTMWPCPPPTLTEWCRNGPLAQAGPMWDPALGMETGPKTDEAQTKLLRRTNTCGTVSTVHMTLVHWAKLGWFLASSVGCSQSSRTVWFPDGFPVLGPNLFWGSLHGCPRVFGDTSVLPMRAFLDEVRATWLIANNVSQLQLFRVDLSSCPLYPVGLFLLCLRPWSAHGNSYWGPRGKHWAFCEYFS